MNGERQGKMIDIGEWLERKRKQLGIDTGQYSPEGERKRAEAALEQFGVSYQGLQFRPADVLSAKVTLDRCASCDADPSALERCPIGGYHPVFLESGSQLTVAYSRCKRRAEFERREEIRRLMDTIPAQLRKKTFKSFRIDGVTESVREAVKAAWEATQSGRSLVLAGDIGTGKTHLAAAIVMHAIGCGKAAIFSTTPKLMSRLKSFGPGGDYQKVLNAVSNCDVLALDDLGVERYTDWISEQLFTVINDRYLAQRQTIITTNLATPQDLINRMDFTEWRGQQERVGNNGERIVSRICEMGDWVHVIGADHRLQGKAS